MNELERAARNVADGRPGKTELVVDNVLNYARRVQQLERLAFVRQPAVERTQRLNTVPASQFGRVLRYHQILRPSQEWCRSG